MAQGDCSALPIGHFRSAQTFNHARFVSSGRCWPMLLWFVSNTTVEIHILPQTHIGSRWWSDLLWFLFVPYTLVTLTWLKPLESSAAERTADGNTESQATALAERCASMIADELQIAKTRHVLRGMRGYFYAQNAGTHHATLSSSPNVSYAIVP